MDTPKPKLSGTPPKKTRATLYLLEDEQEYLKAFADARGLAASDVMRRALELEFLAQAYREQGWTLHFHSPDGSETKEVMLR